MAIKIPFLSDVTDFIRGTDNIADALDEVSDSLDDLSKDSTKAADKAGDNLGDGFKDGAKTAGKALDGVGDDLDGVAKTAKGLDDKVSSAFDSIAADAKKAGKKVETEFKAGTEAASEGMEQMSGDAQSNATEVAASFDGSADSLVEGFQGAAAEMFSGFGPAGAAAGLAVAAGIGAAMTAMDELKEKNDAATEAVGSLGAEIVDAGGALDAADIEGKLTGIFDAGSEDNKWTFWNDESETQLAMLKDGLGDANDELARFTIKGLAGSIPDGIKALEGLTKEIEANAAEIKKHQEQDERGVTLTDQVGQALQERNKKLEETKAALEDATGASEEASSQAEYYTKVMGESQAAAEAETEALLAKADAMDIATGRAMSADQAQLRYIESLTQSTTDIATNGRTTDINTEAGRANRQTLLDLAGSANSLRDAQIEQGASTADVTAETERARASFVAAAEQAGFGADEAKRLADQYGLIPENVDTKVQAHNVQETKDAIDGVAAPRTVPVNLTPDGSEIERFIEGMNGKTIRVAVQGRGGGGITY